MIEESPHRTDNALLLAIAGGDQYAFRLLMERHARPMLALAERVTGSAEDADEIVQEAFLKVWKMAENWDSEGAAAFSTWFYRVVFNAGIDRKRRMRSAPLEEAGDPADPGPGGSEKAESRQRCKTVLAAMDGLPERQRKAMSLFYFSELGGPEAAKILGMKLGALEALLVRGRRNLRKLLAERGIVAIGDIL